MKYFIIISLASLALGDKLENVYLPPHAGSSSGANAGLQAPIGGFGGQSYQGSYDQGNQYQESQSYSQGSQNQAQILKYENVQDENGYRYAFETSDGTKAEQQGNVIPGAAPEEGSLQVQGSYSYIGDDGQTYEVTYTADENGYQARGAHLPTPPPIPEEILKSLQLTAGNQYDNQRNSYDADRNGY